MYVYIYIHTYVYIYAYIYTCIYNIPNQKHHGDMTHSHETRLMHAKYDSFICDRTHLYKT